MSSGSLVITKEEVFPLPDLGVSPHLVSEFFTPELFQSVKQQVEATGIGTSRVHYHPMMARWESGIALSDDIEAYVLEKVRRIFNDDSILKAYHFLVRYQRKNGCIPNLWNHTDQNGSQISINIAIENTADWTLTVEGKEYPQKANDAVVFCGQQHIHGRTPYPTKDESVFVTQLFMHYSLPNHWIQRRGENNFHTYGRDGDIRYFNRKRYLPLPDPPVNQEICKCHDYSNVLDYYTIITGSFVDSEPELVDMTVVSKEELAPGIMRYSFPESSAEVLKGLAQNAMFKQWQQANVLSDDNSLETNYSARNCFNYFLGDGQLTCHPQDPIRRVHESLNIGINNIVEDYKTRYGIRFPLQSSNTVLLRYEEDNHFHNHIDDHPLYPRVVSVSVFLNDNFHGGELEFKEFNLKITPKAGDVIVFSSGFPYMHRVLSIENGIRYAAVKWYNHAERESAKT